MTKRGRILRDTSIGPGLVAVDGQQHTFTLEGLWKSDVPPRIGQVVDVAFLPDGNIASLTAVNENQLAKEQAEQAMTIAREKGSALLSSAVAKFGLGTLIAIGLLIVGWFFLTTVTINAGFGGKLSFTFWHVLSFVNAGGNPMQSLRTLGGESSAGLYGFLALIALIGPFLSFIWKDKKAHLGGLLPLAFMLLVFLLIRHTISASTESADVPAEFADMARKEMMKAISIGMGAYLSILAALYLAYASVKTFLVQQAYR